MLVGYCRISRIEQSLDLQKDALLKAGCEQIFEDTISGGKRERPGLAKILDFVRAGDTIVVWRLDRLGRNLKDLLEIVETLEKRQVNFKSLTESMDTSTPGGKLIFHFFGAVAEFERNLIRDRVNAGLAAARARGRIGGRRQKYSDELIRTAVKYANDHPEVKINEVCKKFGISKVTFYRRSN